MNRSKSKLFFDGKENNYDGNIPYKDRLSFFSQYLQQLMMESLGKERTRRGDQLLQKSKDATVERIAETVGSSDLRLIRYLVEHCRANQ